MAKYKLAAVRGEMRGRDRNRSGLRGTIAGLLGAVLALLSGPAPAANWTMYDSYSQSYYVPYQNNLDSVLAHGGSLTVGVRLNGYVLNPTMDTGSTGVVASATVLHMDPSTLTGPQGWVFYNSTGLLVTGRFETLTMTLLGAVNAQGVSVPVEATIPVLVVTGAQCLGIGANSENCSASGAVAYTLMMGVGFDRNTMGTGVVDTSHPLEAANWLNNAPTTSQAYNPFLNIAGMAAGDLRRGYIITPTGVDLGLTKANTGAAAYSYGQLVLQSAGQPGAAGNWQSVQAKVTAGQGAAQVSGTGTLLMDTGVNDAFIGIPGASSGTAANGTVVTLVLEGGIASYSFVVGDASNPQAPSPVFLFNPSSQFVNSSVHTYAGFNVLFDADGGFIGIALNGYSGITASVTQMIAASGTLALTQDFATDLPVLLMSASTISTPAVASFSGDIMGPGSLTLAGGTIYLNGAVYNAGGTFAATGTTVLNGTLTGSLTIAAPATFYSANGGYSVAVGQTLVNAGTFAAPAAVSLVNAGTTVNSGTIAANFINTGTTFNSGTFTANVANSGSFTNSGTLTAAVTNSGTLSNSGTIGGGVTSSGTLVNNGAIGGLLSTTGVVSGNGTVGSLAVGAGGVVSPGNSIGTTTVQGNATFQPGSVLLVELGAPGLSDRLVVGGTLTAGGATLSLVTGAGFMPQLGASYQVISAGGIASNFTVSSATFGNVGALYPFLGGSLSNTGSLTLTRSSVPFAAFAQTANQAAVAVAADTISLSAPLAQNLATMGSAQVPATFASLSGEIYASAQSVLQTQSAYVRGAVMGRLEQAEGAIAGGPRAVALAGLGGTLWGQAYGGWGSASGDGNASATTSSIGGFLIGLDGAVGDWRLGFAGGFGQSNFSTDTVPGSGSSDNYDVVLYAGRSFGGDANGAFKVRGGLAYSWHDLSVDRSTLVPSQAIGPSQGYSAGYSAGTTQVFGELGYAFAVPGAGVPLTLEPFASLSYVALATNGFTETPNAANLMAGNLGAAALSAQSSSFDTLSTTLGLRASTVLTMGAVPPVTLSGLVGWQHAFGDITPTTTLAFASGSLPFTVAGTPLAQDAVLLGAGLSARLGEALEVSIAYSGQLGSGVTENAVKGSLAWRF